MTNRNDLVERLEFLAKTACLPPDSLEAIREAADALRSAMPQGEAVAQERGDAVCEEDDGCPTEGARLKREWRQMRAQLAAHEARERELVEALKAAFYEGFASFVSLSDSPVTDDDAWETSQAKALAARGQKGD